MDHHQLSHIFAVITSLFCSLKLFILFTICMCLLVIQTLENEYHEFKFFVIFKQLKAFIESFTFIQSILFNHFEFYIVCTTFTRCRNGFST